VDPNLPLLFLCFRLGVLLVVWKRIVLLIVH